MSVLIVPYDPEKGQDPPPFPHLPIKLPRKRALVAEPAEKAVILGKALAISRISDTMVPLFMVYVNLMTDIT